MTRTYNKLKLFRTYIGGSKKERFRLFLETQGANSNGITYDNKGFVYDKEGNRIIEPDVNWQEYKRLNIIDFEDIIHVMYSRKIIFQKFSQLFLIISTIFLFSLIKMPNLTIYFIISFIISIILHLLSLYYMKRTKKEIKNYKIVIYFTNLGLKNKYGLHFENDI